MGRQHVGRIGDNGFFKASLVEYVFDIAIVGVLADHGFRPGIVDHVFDFVRSVDWRNRNDDRPHFLDGQKRHDPLDRIGDVDHNPVALFNTQSGQGAGEPFA